jgi:hypothetical protein
MTHYVYHILRCGFRTSVCPYVNRVALAPGKLAVVKTPSDGVAQDFVSLNNHLQFFVGPNLFSWVVVWMKTHYQLPKGRLYLQSAGVIAHNQCLIIIASCCHYLFTLTTFATTFIPNRNLIDFILRINIKPLEPSY